MAAQNDKEETVSLMDALKDITTMHNLPVSQIDLFESEVKLRTLNDFTAYCQTYMPGRTAFENRLTALGKHKQAWQMAGYCQACEQMTGLVADWHSSDKITPNYRERLVCPVCRLNNRQRYSMGLLKKMVSRLEGIRPVIYLYEQVTPFYHYAVTKLSEADIIGSEYFGFEHKSGEVINGIRHEDAMALSFANESIDLIMSNDVYEHVPDYKQSLKEAYRVIKHGGKLVFSIPFYANRDETRYRAVLEEGSIKHLLPEQYHGNPMLNKGSLVFNDFGWDILKACKEAGFADAYALTYYSVFFGNIGGGAQQVFIAEK